MKRELMINGKKIEQRKAEFRAKRVSNNAWVYGHYFETGLDEKSTKAFIINSNVVYEVDPTTACQYVWRKDDKGNKIYEHDILRRGNGYNVVIPRSRSGWDGVFTVGHDAIKIAGNIFDTPELIEKTEEDIRKESLKILGPISAEIDLSLSKNGKKSAEIVANQMTYQEMLDMVNKRKCDNGYTIEYIAEKCGLRKSTISRILLGQNTPNMISFLKLLESLDFHFKIEED